MLMLLLLLSGGKCMAFHRPPSIAGTSTSTSPYSSISTSASTSTSSTSTNGRA